MMWRNLSPCDSQGFHQTPSALLYAFSVAPVVFQGASFEAQCSLQISTEIEGKDSMVNLPINNHCVALNQLNTIHS